MEILGGLHKVLASTKLLLQKVGFTRIVSGLLKEFQIKWQIEYRGISRIGCHPKVMYVVLNWPFIQRIVEYDRLTIVS